MKQASVKLPNGEYLIQEVPDKLLWVSRDNIECDGFSFPLNGLKLLGADPVNLTEVEAGEIVPKLFVPAHGLDGRSGKVYSSKEQIDGIAELWGISKPYIILKNV